MGHIMRGKARYEQVAQHVIRQMYLDDESVEGIMVRMTGALLR